MSALFKSTSDSFLHFQEPLRPENSMQLLQQFEADACCTQA